MEGDDIERGLGWTP